MKIIKNLMKKAELSNPGFWFALLYWRNTTPNKMGSSPVQRLCSRQTRTILPTFTKHLKPATVEDVEKVISTQREQSKKIYDRHTKELPKLEEGEIVWIRNKDSIWKPGKLEKKKEDGSCDVEINGKNNRRNRGDVISYIAVNEQKNTSPSNDTVTDSLNKSGNIRNSDITKAEERRLVRETTNLKILL